MTDQISFPPLLDLSPGELHTARERLLNAITQRSTRRAALTQRFHSRAVLVGGIAVTVAATAIALPTAFWNSGDQHSSAPRYPVGGAGKLWQNSISVANVEEADARLPFRAVLPSNAEPIDGIQVPIAGTPSDASGWLTTHFDANGGTYMLSEYTSDATVETLQQWADENCSGCTTQQVVTEDGVHVLVLASSVFGLRLQWLRGDGTSPVMTELDWSTDMPANNAIPSQKAALAIAGDIIRQGG